MIRSSRRADSIAGRKHAFRALQALGRPDVSTDIDVIKAASYLARLCLNAKRRSAAPSAFCSQTDMPSALLANFHIWSRQ